MNLANFTICNTFVKPLVDSIQTLINIMYLPLTFLGVSAPPVGSWFNWIPGLTCI